MTNQRSRRYNEQFSRLCAKQILSRRNHPLSFLIDPRTRRWHATRHGKDVPAVQVGHAESLHAGGPERLFLEDADYNQLSNWKGERQGAVFKKTGVIIGGVHVESRSAKMWESVGLLPKGTVARSPRSSGWIPR